MLTREQSQFLKDFMTSYLVLISCPQDMIDKSTTHNSSAYPAITISRRHHNLSLPSPSGFP